MSSVDILLATFDGERFLQAQLDSIARQTHKEWRLLVRDDGSSDSSMEIVESFGATNPGRVHILADSGTRLGPSLSFGRLLAETEADTIMFCDQDDVWLPHKLERSVSVLRGLEARLGSRTPILVHSDLAVVDEDLRPVASSFQQYQKLGNDVRLNRLLVQNCVTGCTVTINRPLRDAAVPLPSEAAMHDWWLALMASAVGHIGHIAEPTVFYRQHGGNSLGARAFDLEWIARRAAGLDEVRASLALTRRQAHALLHRTAAMVDRETAVMLETYARLDEAGFWRRRKALFDHGFWKTGIIRNLGLLLTI